MLPAEYHKVLVMKMNFSTRKKTVLALAAVPLIAVATFTIVGQQTATGQSRVTPIDNFAAQPVDGFVPVVATGGRGTARYPGYARASDLQPPKMVGSKFVVIDGKEVRVPDVPNVPVYAAKDLTTIVGHMVMGIGFVPIGTDLSALSPFDQKDPPLSASIRGTIPK